MNQIYLVKLKECAKATQISQIHAFLQARGAEIIMVATDGAWVLVSLPDPMAEELKRIPLVETVGSVTFKERKVKVIRVQKP